MYWLTMIILAFSIALLLTGLVIPQVLHIAFRRKLFDKPDDRKIHNGFVPRLGGTVFFPTVVCAISLSLGIFFNCDFFPPQEQSPINFEPILFCLCAVTILYPVGLADDLQGVRYRTKFIAQIICALLIIWSGGVVMNLHGLFGIYELPEFVAWIVSIFLIVYIVNSINLIDGIDGLASGIATITLAFYGWIFWLAGEYMNSMVAWTTCASLIAFFYFNVFGKSSNQKKIFMGDTGSLTIGIIIAYLAICICNLHLSDSFQMMKDANPMVVAFSPLVIPLFDVVRVAIHRIRCHRNPFLPDRSHIHHKLLAMGLSPAAALSIILAASLFIIAFNSILSPMININILLLLDVLFWTVANFFINRKITRREIQLGKKLYT